MDRRIAQRRRSVREARRRARLRRTLVGTLVVAVLVALAIVERSELVALERIEVTGIERLAEADVLAAAALEPGTSVARLGLRAARARVVALALVRDATVRRDGLRSVRIEVDERRPALVVRGGGVQRLVDREGVVIAEGAAPGVTEVRSGVAPPAVGELVDDAGVLGDALRLWRGLSGPVRAEVVRIDALVADDLTLVLESGTRVRIGRADRLDEKVRAFGAIAEDLGDVEVRIIDVRSPTAPVVVPR